MEFVWDSRDLKPANVIVGDDGRVKLLDFGLAKLTEKAAEDPGGAIVGTVLYMSPEQAEGKKVDDRSDIFSFGSVLYEMVTGRRAFEGGTKISTLSAILHKEPQPLSEVSPGVPAELERIIARCLRKDPDRRAQGIADVKLALEELREESESGRVSSQSAAVLSLAKPRRRFGAITAGVVALAVADEDGSGLRKATDLPVVGVMGQSPDRNWLVLGSRLGGFRIFPVGGGAPIETQIKGPVFEGWSGDGKHVFVQSRSMANAGKSYVLPLAAGRIVPERIIDGLPTEQECLKTPGARVIDSIDVAPGPTADIYAFRRESVQRNLYRIPLP